MSYSLPVLANTRNVFLFVQDHDGNWVPAQSGDIGADKWAVKITGFNRISGDKIFHGNTSFGGTFNVSGISSFHNEANFLADLNVSGGLTSFGIATFNSQAYFEEVATFYNDVSMQSSLSVNGGVTIDGQLSVGEDAYMSYLEIDGDVVHGGMYNDVRYVQKTGAFFRTSNINSGAITLNTSHNSGYFRIGNATGSMITVSTQAAASWPLEVEMMFCQGLSGQISFTGAVGVTINSSESYKTAKQYATVLLKKVGTNQWDLLGEREVL